ncbi:MAG: single-stranded-DNA-specific exonuclease RecJ, partial [Burkholderiaceae bacterium]|nr:single-stranded-DNA-specific exonuclease RecJ [Burkholderiaceae bacterium]
EAFDAFAQAFEQVGRELLSAQQLERVLETDGSLEDAYFTTQFIELLDGQVWGQGFAPPLFCDEFKVVTQRVLKEKHLKLLLERDGRKYDAIWFGHPDGLPERVKLVYRLDANEFNGVTRVQLMVEYAEEI